MREDIFATVLNNEVVFGYNKLTDTFTIKIFPVIAEPYHMKPVPNLKDVYYIASKDGTKFGGYLFKGTKGNIEAKLYTLFPRESLLGTLPDKVMTWFLEYGI